MTDPFERWPGYNEQSWSERFAELDRQHHRLLHHTFPLVVSRPAALPPSDEDCLAAAETAIRNEIFRLYGTMHVNGGTELAQAALTALTPLLDKVREEALEEVKQIVLSHRAPAGVPTIDYDQACDDIGEAIAAIQSRREE